MATSQEKTEGPFSAYKRPSYFQAPVCVQTVWHGSARRHRPPTMERAREAPSAASIVRPFRLRGTIGSARTKGATTARVTMLMAHPALVASASITQPTDPALLPRIGVPSFRGRTGLGQNQHLFSDRNSEAHVACACGPFVCVCVCLVLGSGYGKLNDTADHKRRAPRGALVSLVCPPTRQPPCGLRPCHLAISFVH